jgi:hypothetical protein
MTSEQLIAEGRRLERPCIFLKPHGNGPVSAVWHERDKQEIDSSGHHCWLTVDARQIPLLEPSASGYLSIFTDEKRCQGGRVEVMPAWPKRGGTQLYAHVASVLPPLDAVFRQGSESVQIWLRENGWERGWRYNDNFKDQLVAKAYEKVFMTEFPLYFESDTYAILGGWHLPGQDDDWEELIDEHLVVLTVRDSEPWVEAWHTSVGKFRVIQRIT